MQAGQVSDTSENDVPAGVLGTFQVNTDTVPEIDAELRIVTGTFASDHMSDAAFASYTSIDSVGLGSTYYAEIWLRDVGTIQGISGGSVDIAYTTAFADATGVDHGGVYNLLSSGTIHESDGLVDNIGGATFNAGEGTTQWVRFGYVTFDCTGVGDVEFVLDHDLTPAPPGTTNPQFAEAGAGTMPWASINWTGTPHTVTQGGGVDVYLVPRIAPTGSDTSTSQPTSDHPDPDFWKIESCDYYVEVWVRSDQASAAAISGGSVNVTFDPQYAQAVGPLDHGSVFTLLPVDNIDNTTGVVSIGGGTLATDMGDNEYVCLGRIEFQGTAPVDEVGHVYGPYDMGLDVTDGPNSFALVGAGNVSADHQPVPDVESRAMIYDIDDSGLVDFGDFSYFVPAFMQTVGGTEPPYADWADFDNSGLVDFGDFSFFVTAFMKQFCDPTISFPVGGNGGWSTPALSVGGAQIQAPAGALALPADEAAVTSGFINAPVIDDAGIGLADDVDALLASQLASESASGNTPTRVSADVPGDMPVPGPAIDVSGNPIAEHVTTAGRQEARRVIQHRHLSGPASDDLLVDLDVLKDALPITFQRQSA